MLVSYYALDAVAAAWTLSAEGATPPPPGGPPTPPRRRFYFRDLI
ncbi:MAG: hypothetical protein ACR2GH_02330 [Pseudonocardia sp.]